MIHRSVTVLLQRFNKSDTGLSQTFFRMGDLRLNTETNKLESVVSICIVITDMVTMITYLRVIKFRRRRGR